MTISPVDFASLLCSRLCHDLLSPVGALNSGLNFAGPPRQYGLKVLKTF